MRCEASLDLRIMIDLDIALHAEMTNSQHKIQFENMRHNSFTARGYLPG